MAGKRCFVAGVLYYPLDHLSKNALIDLVVDRARAQIGEDASDEQLAELIQDWLDPVSRVRGDRTISLLDKLQLFYRQQENYRKNTEAAGRIAKQHAQDVAHLRTGDTHA